METKQIKCECGVTITGRTENIMKANLKRHQKAKYHKRILKILEKK